MFFFWDIGPHSPSRSESRGGGWSKKGGELKGSLSNPKRALNFLTLVPRRPKKTGQRYEYVLKIQAPLKHKRSMISVYTYKP